MIIQSIEVGDEIRVVFTIGEVQNAAGVSVETVYNSEYLTAENIVCTVSGSESNIAVPGEVKWNFLVYSGINFNNTDVAVVTFRALKPCSFYDINIMYNCREFINPDLQRITDEPNSLFKVRAVHNDVEYDVHTIGSPYTVDTEIDNSDIQNPHDTTDTDIYDNTDNTNNSTDIDRNENTDSTAEKNSSSKITKTTDTDKTKDTDTVKASKQDSNKNTSSEKVAVGSGTTLQAAHSPSTGDNAVNTSGSQSFTVIMLLAVMIVSGAASVILNKNKYQE